MNSLIFGLVLPAGLLILALLVMGFAFSRMYKRSTREVSLVKTGAGGKKVIMDGGTLVIPVLHEITRINMMTTRLEVRRDGSSALITKDRMRVDVGVEFYVTVAGTVEGVSRAAQTLGSRTFDISALKDMIEGKLVDALRSVAAQMTLDELHENRSSFVQEVQKAVSEDLTKNGLELESVALTGLDQTPIEGLDEDNAFNAIGLQKHAELIAHSRKKRAEIEAEAEVAVALSKQKGEVGRYKVEQDQEAARVAQSVEMESLRTSEIIDKAKKTEDAARESETAAINRQKSIETAQIMRQKEIELAEQDRQIAIQRKSEEESVARAAADVARAEAVKATESIETERSVAVAERTKRITLLKAEEQAEEQATSIRVSAAAERAAASDRAAAMRELAQAEADEITIRAEAEKVAKLADAEGTRELIAAENTLSAEIIDFRLAQQRLTALPGIVAEMVKPAEKIGNITIHKIDGLNGGRGMASGGVGENGGSNGGSNGLINQAFDEIRRNAFELPALSAIGKSVGVNMDSGIAGILGKEFSPVSTQQVVEEAPAKPAEDAGIDADVSAKG